jgi:hypothetical protein
MDEKQGLSLAFIHIVHAPGGQVEVTAHEWIGDPID